MSDLLQTATESLLASVNLNENSLQEILSTAMTRQIDSADIYLQSTSSEEWYLEDGIVKEGDYNIDRGFGFRVLSGEKTGFAYADDIGKQSLLEAAKSARAIVHSGHSQSIALAHAQQIAPLYPDINPLHSLEDAAKIELLKKMDARARVMDPRVEQVVVRLSGEHNVLLYMDSEGHLSADVRPLVCLSVRVVALQNGRREVGSAGAGGRNGYQMFMREKTWEQLVDKAVRQALLNLEAIAAPAGTMPVVLGPGWPAVLLHEAVGHGLEGDFNRKGSSAFSGRLGERVASNLCTIVDDGTLPELRGSLSVDDEGTPSQNTVLIEKGVLKNYMQDKHNARLMKMSPTGNGRRESYADLPLPRMTNTYMLPGKSDPQEIIASVKKGIYASDFAGGQVDITSGKFVFSTSEAYLIENGKITKPIKGATLAGDGPDVLNRVGMVGNDLALDKGIGTCGKAGQTVPVGVGQPTLKIEQMTVGGVSES